MKWCTACQTELPPIREPVAFCPRCGIQQDLPVDGPWKLVARCRSVAEAGFLADELRDAEIAARVTQHDTFGAADGHWETRFLVQVPAPQAADAFAHLKQRVEEEASEEDEPLAAGASPRTAFKLLVAVTLGAGAAGFALTTSPPRANSVHLHRLQSGETLPELDTAGPPRRLRVHPDSGRLLLERFDPDAHRYRPEARFGAE